MSKELSIKNAFESSIVDEVVDVIIPQFVSSVDKNILTTGAGKILEAFGISKYFSEILQDESHALEREIFKRGASNIHLLIDKTWVESNDAFFKSETVKKLDAMEEEMTAFFRGGEGSYLFYFEQFYRLLKKVIYLLFGKEANRDSLVEYVLRMEPHFGLFCYYVEAMGALKELDEYKARLAMLIAIVFLSEF